MLLPLVKQTLYCWAWNRIYVKANGRVPCWCDAGEPHTVIHKDLSNCDFITDIVNSIEMRRLRLTIIRDAHPYIQECDRCCCLLRQDQTRNKRYLDSDVAENVSHQAKQALQELRKTARLRGWDLGSIDRISEIQLEPSFPCNLRCPGCLHGWHPEPLKSEVPPYLLPLDWFTRIVDSIVEHAVRLERIAFVGRGEPTLNKSFPQMLNYARANLPRLTMSMDTNSTQPFKTEYLLMTWINCSIDGSTKESYDTYRRGGDFSSAIEFMRQAATKKKQLGRDCKIRWKYILFSTNSEKRLLDKAQEMAKEIGVDELDFVITACGAADGSILPFPTTVAEMTNYINNNKIFHNTIVSRS
jgi:sulfatase maturation enzyme AslB (radical SAM superfamily)